MELSKFVEKFNKIEGNSYTFEEEVTLTNGIYVGYLEHDNVVKESIAIYTGSGLTGTKIKNYFLSSPTLAPWKYQIKIYATDIEKAYISYETTGDQVEADDINNLQNELVRTQKAVNTEESRAVNKETEIENNLNTYKTEVAAELSNRYTKEEVLRKIEDLIGSAPETLDTLKELADALGNDPNFATTIINMLGEKVDKEEGKVLTTNDYTNEEKQKVESAYNLRIPYILVEGENNVFTATVEGITEYKDGLPLCIKLPIDATDICTLNVNGLEAITILDSQNLKANIPYNIRYEITSNSFILQTKGGGGIDTSDATVSAEDLLINKTAYGPNGKIEGAMPNNSGINKVLALNETYSIPKGYQDGTSKVTQNIANNGALNGSIGVNGIFNIPAGYTSGGKVTQSIVTQGAYTGAVSAVEYNPMYLRIPQGAYFTNTSAGYPEITIPRDWLISCLGVDANKIVSGQSIAGVAGSANKLNINEGTFVGIDGSWQTVNLGYKPRAIYSYNSYNQTATYKLEATMLTIRRNDNDVTSIANYTKGESASSSVKMQVELFDTGFRIKKSLISPTDLYWWCVG